MTQSPHMRRVRLAPDWLPNTNHIGFYVARTLGYYADVGIELEILRFDGEAMPNRRIVSGETEFGLMPHQSIISMRARGVDVVSVAALAQPNTTTLAVREESGVTRLAQLAGKRYASFGTEFEAAMVETMILRDGGSSGALLVPAEKLDILAELSTGALDVAWGFFAWEGIQARLAGHALRHFFVAEHGIPSEYFPLLFTSAAYIDRARDTARAFVAATARGYTYAIAHPDEAARIFLASVAPTDLPEHAPELVESSLEWLAPRFNGTLAGQPLTSPWGWHAADVWTKFAAFIRDLARRHGLTAPEPEAETRGYTNEFIPR